MPTHHTCIKYTLMMQHRWWGLDFSLTEVPLFHLEIFKKMDINPLNGWSNKNRSGTYWCFFCPSVKDPIGFWPRLPDEHLRIISEADLIYVLCRWGHPNDLPRHGRHQSPPTRGHSKHAWERERGGTPKHPQGCLCLGTCADTLYKCIFCKCLCIWMCTWVTVFAWLEQICVCLIMYVYAGRIVCVHMCASLRVCCITHACSLNVNLDV